MPRWKIIATAALVYPLVVAALVHDAAVRGWLRSYGDLERSGQWARFGIGQAAVVERSNLVASDPSVTLPVGGAGFRRARDIILAGLEPKGVDANELRTELGDTSDPALDWDDPTAWDRERVAIRPGYVRDRYVVVSLMGGGKDCRRLLDGLSPYTLSRARAAWSTWTVEYGRDDLPGVSWSGPGETARACKEAGRPGLDVFLLRFDLVRPTRGDAGTRDPSPAGRTE